MARAQMPCSTWGSSRSQCTSRGGFTIPSLRTSGRRQRTNAPVSERAHASRFERTEYCSLRGTFPTCGRLLPGSSEQHTHAHTPMVRKHLPTFPSHYHHGFFVVLMFRPLPPTCPSAAAAPKTLTHRWLSGVRSAGDSTRPRQCSVGEHYGLRGRILR